MTERKTQLALQEMKCSLAGLFEYLKAMPTKKIWTLEMAVCVGALLIPEIPNEVKSAALLGLIPGAIVLIGNQNDEPKHR
jgi:hypothetical protein